MAFPSIPKSPLTHVGTTKSSKPSANESYETERPTTPLPVTPPRNTPQLPISSLRTPISKKESSIRPPEGVHEDVVDLGMNRTPRKHVCESSIAEPNPVTPRKLFHMNQSDSPYRTPGGIFGLSPFRTPRSRTVFDPHDPSALLDEELSRMGTAGYADSPDGLFGKAHGSLLYDSPGLSSPDQWQKWW